MNHTAHIPGLPVTRTALIGRARELEVARSILTDADTRLLTLTGVGGCGKTRLAFQLLTDMAPDYPGRIWAVELASVSDPELLPIVVAEALGLQGRGVNSPIAALCDYLGNRPALLLLDNCEHLIDACAEFVDTLLSACPDLLVLATSREPLRVAGERQYRVPPLDVPNDEELAPGGYPIDVVAVSAAVQLFLVRAQAVLPSFELTPTNADAVARICARLEGIPLALELAAAWVRVLGIEQILARLDDSFQLLTDNSRVAPTRHQTMRAALEWSDALLTESEQAVFRRLAVFAGEFQLRAVETLCANSCLAISSKPLDSAPGSWSPECIPDGTLEVLTGLVDKSLVMAVSDDQAAWYRLLEPVRQYASEQLAAHGEMEDVRARHAAYYLDLAERAWDGTRGPEQETWFDRLEREQGNLRAALDWARQQEESATELRIGAALVPFWGAHGHQAEGLRRLRGMLARSTANGAPALRVRALSGAARMSTYLGNSLPSRFSEAEEFASEALRLARELGDDYEIATALNDLGLVYQSQNDPDRAITCLEQALTYFRDLKDEHGTAMALANLGATVGSQGNLAEARNLFIESRECFRAAGDLRWETIVQVYLGRNAHNLGEFERAIQLLVEGMTTHQRLGDRWFVAFRLRALGGVLIDAGHPRQGVELIGAAQALGDRLGSPGLPFADITDRVDRLRQEEWFDPVWAAGYALGPNEAVRAARVLLDCPVPPEEPNESVQSDLALLTPRELEVARLLVEGYTNQQIGDALYITAGTVAAHVHHILEKLELQSRTQVAGWLVSHEST